MLKKCVWEIADPVIVTTLLSAPKSRAFRCFLVGWAMVHVVQEKGLVPFVEGHESIYSIAEFPLMLYSTQRYIRTFSTSIGILIQFVCCVMNEEVKHKKNITVGGMANDPRDEEMERGMHG